MGYSPTLHLLFVVYVLKFALGGRVERKPKMTKRLITLAEAIEGDLALLKCADEAMVNKPEKIGLLLMEDSTFALEMSVRDYECDLQGVVNNSVYQNYLEHARHVYLKSVGIDFKEYTEKGITLRVVRAEIDYKYPLTSGDKFVVTVALKMESRVRFAFHQEIRLIPEQKTVIKGKIIGVALNLNGRPYIPEDFEKIIDTKNGHINQ